MKSFICPRCNIKNNLFLVKSTRKENEYKCSICSLKIKFRRG